MNDCKEWEAWDLQSFYKNDLGFNAFLVYPARRNYQMKYNKRILCMDGTVNFEVEYINYPELVQLIVFNHPTKAYGEIINIQNDRYDEYRLDKALEELGAPYLIINPSIKKAYKRMMSKTRMRLYWSSFAFSTISKDRMLISPKQPVPIEDMQVFLSRIEYTFEQKDHFLDSINEKIHTNTSVDIEDLYSLIDLEAEDYQKLSLQFQNLEISYDKKLISVKKNFEDKEIFSCVLSRQRWGVMQRMWLADFLRAEENNKIVHRLSEWLFIHEQDSEV